MPRTSVWAQLAFCLSLYFSQSHVVHLSPHLRTLSRLFLSGFLSPVVHAGTFRLTFLLFCCCLSLSHIHPCPLCPSVLCSPFLFPVFVARHVSVSLFSLHFCPLFAAISISFFVTLLQSKLCPLFPNVTILYLFFPLFFRVTSFSAPPPPPLSAVFFSQVSVRRGFTFSQDRQPMERGLLADQRLRL